jgi:hypothetical protein
MVEEAFDITFISTAINIKAINKFIQLKLSIKKFNQLYLIY